MEEILISASPREMRVATICDGVLSELHVEREASHGLVGNIYMGRVIRVLPGMQSAFVDIGLERSAFLHVIDIEKARKDNGEMLPIEQFLIEGQSIMVQVAKDPISTKGARLTTTISLAGRKLVYLPHDNHIGVSQRIEDESRRAALREQMSHLIKPDTKGGYIIRTCAEEGVTDEEFLADMDYLGRLWKEISYKALHQSVPVLIYEDLSLAQRVLRDMLNAETRYIRIDSRSTYQSVITFAERFVPKALPVIRFYESDRPLFETYGVEEEIEKSLSRRVNLKSGGYLIVDQNEAMSTIDVNTGAFVGKRDFSETVFKTNLEAAQMIARQLRLRNLGGIIIIDFIDMVSDEHRAAVLAELRRAISVDHTKLTVSEFTELGLVEMTRKRTRESIAHVLCEPCPVCAGRGEVKTARTICYTILREIVRENRQYKQSRGFKILASQTVIDLFLEEESAALDLLQETIGKPITLEVEGAYMQEQYDVLIL